MALAEVIIDLAPLIKPNWTRPVRLNRLEVRLVERVQAHCECGVLWNGFCQSRWDYLLNNTSGQFNSLKCNALWTIAKCLPEYKRAVYRPVYQWKMPLWRERLLQPGNSSIAPIDDWVISAVYRRLQKNYDWLSALSMNNHWNQRKRFKPIV